MKNYYLKSLFASFLLLSLFSCAYEYKEVANKVVDDKGKHIVVKGSTTVHPLMEELKELFESNPKNAKVEVTSTGSLEGLESLLHDSADIAMASNKITPELRAEFRKVNKEFVEYLLAGDALVFVVNVNNAVKKLTIKELQDIFTGKITNWNQVGGPSLPIKVVSRDIHSGTFSFFKESLLQEGNLFPGAAIYHSNLEVLKEVSKDKVAIGYTNFSTLDYSVDPLSISFDNSKIYVSPRVETVNNMTYKYNRGMYLYYNPEKYRKIKPLMDMIHADSTQKFIGEQGFIPVNTKLMMK